MTSSEVFKQFYMKLVTSLPMKDVVFLAALYTKDLCSGGLKDKVKAMPTATEAADFFLDNKIEKDLINDNTDSFLKLLSVMEEYNESLKVLAMEIKGKLKVEILPVSSNHEQPTNVTEKLKKKHLFFKKYQIIKQRLGSEKLRLHKIIIFGPSRAGKSTLLKVLLHKLEGLNEYQQSTMVLDRVEIKSDIKSSKSLWKVLNINDEIDRLRQIIETKIPVDSPDDIVDNPLPSVIQPDLKVETALLECVEKHKPDTVTTHFPSISKGAPASDLKIKKQLTTFIACYDSGGQAEFFDIMPALITVSTGNIMVFNMSKNLDSKIESEYYENGECWSKNMTHYTTVELMNIALANIQRYSKNCQCFTEKTYSFTNTGDLLVVGTHLDKCGETTADQNRKLVEVDQKICRDVLKTPPLNIIYRKGNKLTSVVHPISNICSKGREEAAQEIRSGIERMSINEHDVPLSWLLFQYEVRLTGKPYVSRDDCIVTAKRCYVKLNESGKDDGDDDCVDIDDILMYFNELGIFLYYNEINELKNIVFCDPEWLFRKLTEIMKLKYNPKYQPGKRESIRQGIFKVKFLANEVCNEGFDKDDNLTFEHLLTLFEHLNIMTKLSEEEFFMPALLDPAPQEPSIKAHYGNKIGDTMLIRYENEYFPRGVFCHMVALLASSVAKQQGWHVQFNNAYKDLVIIKLGCNNEYFILTDKLSHIQVEIYDSDAIPQQSHQVLCFKFNEILNTICCKTNLLNRFELGFTCIKCMKNVAIVHLQYSCVPSQLYCTGGCGTSLMTYNQLLWFVSKESLSIIQNSARNITSQPTKELSLKWKRKSHVRESRESPHCSKKQKLARKYTTSSDSQSSDESETSSSHLPPDNNFWIGDIETHIFDSTGGIFYSFNHGVTVTVPAGAIPEGRQAELKFAATLFAPVKFTPDIIPVSAIIWLCMNVELKKSITLCLPHSMCVKTKHHVNNLHFAKIAHTSPSEGLMKVIEGGEFKIGEKFGLIEINHFCYYCTVFSTTCADNIPENLYKIIAMKHKKPMVDHWKCDVCIIPSLPTCRMGLEMQYDSNFICDEEWSDFSFALSSDKVNIEINESQFSRSAEVKIISNYEINKKQVDFQHWYKNAALKEQLEDDVHHKKYPRRFKLEVANRETLFFHVRRYLRFSLSGGENRLRRDIAIAAVEETDTNRQISTSQFLPSHSGRTDSSSNDFEYEIAEKKLLQQYNFLSRLPVNTLLPSLISKLVITVDQKKDIAKKEERQTGKGMEELLDEVILSSLKAKICDKYKGFLEAMAESDDALLKDAADKLTK